MLIHVLTACSRPEGLAPIGQTLAAAPDGLDVRWHVGYDLARQHVGGQAVKNRLLDDISDGYVWICDDDNLPAPGFLARLLTLPPAPLYLFGQRRPAGRCQPALPPAVGQTDAAQLVAHISAIGGRRLPEQYDGDGHWITAVWAACGGGLLIDEPLTLYNAQRWQ